MDTAYNKATKAYGNQDYENNSSSNQNKLKPSQLLSKQLSGNVMEELNHKPRIIQFLNLGDFSSYTSSAVSIDEPLFEPSPSIIQFTDYEPLQIKDKIFRLRNKDRYARRVKIIPPDSRLFQVLPYHKSKKADIEDDESLFAGSKVAPGMEISFIVRFSPEAKIDYSFNLIVVTEREKFEVPIIATGKRAMIDFPDVLDFEKCPVKYCTEKPIVIRNVGEKTTRWFLQLPAPFDANKKEGFLEKGHGEQIIVTFTPSESKEYNLEAIFSYDNLNSYVVCRGKAENDDVGLSKRSIIMDEAYIGLQTQQTLQIVNKSNVRVDFQWRAFAFEKEELDKKNKLKHQLDQEEAEERILIKEMATSELVNTDYGIDDDNESEDEERDEQTMIVKKQKKAEMLLARKYKNIRKAIEDDQLLFQDDIFTIEPTSGQIWPNSAMTVTVAFKPLAALSYSCTAFCNISCKEERLVLNLAGEGIGPKAVITPQDDIDLGDVTITAIKTKDFTIENRGEIPATFQLLLPDTPAAKMFKFDVDRGILGVGERLNFTVTFQSEMLGEFSETFRFRLEGSTELIPLRFRGHVIGPSFRFDRNEIDFGEVSYSFPKEEYINLINTSPVSFRFSLRIPGDIPDRREFEIQPSRDVINKGEQRSIKVIFTPQAVKKYEMNLKIDILNVGEGLYSIPIFAESSVPTVKVFPPEIIFEKAYLRHKEERELRIINESNLPAKFDVAPQSKESEVLAAYTVNKQSGVIQPMKEEIIKVTLETRKLREIRLPIAIHVVGNTNLPFIVNIIANSIGPDVDISEKEIDFGNIEVLRDWTKTLKVKNNSPIKADFHVFTKTKNSIFKPLQKHGVLERYSAIDIPVLCTPDDTGNFNDILHFVITEGVDIDIPLRAKGTGSTIYSKEDLKNISFGLAYTFKYDHREIFVENKGRRPQKLSWQPKKPYEGKNKKDKQAQTAEKPKSDQPEEEPESVYTVVPDSVLLPPKSGVMFQFRAYSSRVGNVTEFYQLFTQVGNDRKQNLLLDSTLSGEFINPTLSFSEAKMHFKYTWERGVPYSLISRNLEITNVTQLPTNFHIKVAPPFSINKEHFSLIPGRSAIVKVDFDPSLKGDRVSGLTRNKLQLMHVDHPHRDYINLIGEVCFPNLKLETNLINFGSIMSETNKTIAMTIQNVGEMALNYNWSFLENQILRERDEEGFENISRQSLRMKEKEIYSVNDIFDILPTNGTLQPNEIQKIEFQFNALLGQKVKATAIVTAEGGPDYPVQLVGDSSEMTYKLLHKTLDYGVQPFNEWETKDVILENTGKVSFEFKVNLSTIIRKGLIEVTPSSGLLKGFEKLKLHVKMCPGYPDIVDEHFFIEIAHFEPEKITIKGSAIYPAVVMDLPRHDNNDFLRNLEGEPEELKSEERSSGVEETKMSDIDRPVISKAEVEADRRTFVEYINKNLNEKKVLALRTMESFQSPPSNKFSSAIKNLRNEPVSASPGLKNSARSFRGSENFGVVSPTALTARERGDEIVKASVLKEVTSPLAKNMGVSRSLAFLAEDKSQIIDDKSMAMTKNTFKLPGMAGGSNKLLDPKVYSRITLASFICDLENIVLGASKKKTFKITNVSSMPVTFHFDQKVYKLLNMTIVPERVAKLDPDETVSVTVTYQTKKNQKFGRNKMVIPIEVKNGPKINLEVLANITIPEIWFEHENIDFQKAIIGQKKIVYMRFENNKEVTVDWAMSTRADLSSGNDKDGLRFSMSPTSGIIKPGQKQMIEFTFIPLSEKTYNHKFIINIRDNPKVTIIQTRGTGASVSLDFIPEKLSIGPALPYDNKVLVRLDVRNPSDYDTELYSLNYDATYLQEEEMLRAYEELSGHPEGLSVPVRFPGQPFWPRIRKAWEIKQKRLEYNRKMKEINAQPQVDLVAKEALQKEIDEFNLANQLGEEVPPPRKVKDELKHHVIVFGPPGCGKTQLAKHMSTTHQRELVKMDELLEWNRQNNTSAVELADRHLEERKKVYEQVFQEYEKMKKKKKKGEEDIPPNIQDYEYLTEDIIVALLEERLKSPDCNAGIVFDNISNKLYAKELEGVRAILRVLPSQHVQLVNLYYPVDASGLEVSEIVDPAKELISHALPIMANVSTLSRNASQFHSPDEDRRKKSKLSQSTTSKKVKRTDTAQKLITQSDHGAIDNTFTFEVQYPKQLAPEELEQYKAKAKDLLDLVLGQYKEPPPPVVEEVKKDDKSKDTKKTGKKDGKKEEEKPVEVVEVHEEPKIPIPNKTLVANNNRSVISLPIIYNYQQLNQTVMAVVPEPQFPDPDLEPVPVPANFQLLRKPAIRHAPEVSKTFTILTPKDNYINETDTDIIMLDRPLEETTTSQQMRWIIPAKKKISLYVKFFTHTPGYYESVFDFESFYSTKQYKVPCAALCDFPTINSKAINVFMQRKKFRPANPPDCYVSKHYIMSEKVFDFGPLLVGKNSTKRNENNLIYMNSSIFRITNNGKFDAEIDLTLASSVFEGPEYKKGTFIFEPEKFTLAVDQTEDLRVWAFPEAPQLYKDQIICMIKNNPVPVIFDVQCTGVKPIVEVDVNTVKFERLLLNQSSTERLKLKNVCAVPVRWSLKGVDKLPEEFTIKQTEGLLRPTEEKVVEITFRAIKQEKFNYSLELDVEDNEKIGIKQAPIEIKLQAEAFDINVSLDPHNTENMLNFGDVRVGDLKEQKFPIKNIGLYDIKCRFVMKKKLFRENFTIEPSETIIEPNQEKVITFKFCSKDEVKLKTTSSTTDIVLEILEGKSLEIFNKLMVNVTVNAVFSKYSIAPQKSINFGPIQFDEPRSRQFEIKNEGIFEFNYTIFDYSDDARRNEILKLEQPEKEEEKAGGKDAKKKTEPPKPVKKDPKKDKDLGTDLRIGPWSIDPPTGSIAPDSSQTIKVTFKGVGQKLCEQKLGIHISRRDPHDQPLGILHEVVAESCIPGINTEHYDSIFEEQIVIPSLTGSQNVQEQINSNVFAIEEKTFYFGTMVPSKHPNGIQEQFKITNPGKIPCNVKFDVKKRSSSTNELFAFKVKPSSVSIMPHHYKYVTVSFEPETIASYGGLFEAIVENGEQNPRTGKLVFDLRGECALPSLKVERPKEWMDDRTPILRFPKVRVDKAQILPIILKNDGQIPATVEFDIKPNESFRFLDQSTFTISAKTSATFNIEFKPREPGQKRWELIAKTHDNPYENPKIVIVGEGYQEHVIFDKLPNDLTDEINFGDCVVNTEKQISFKVKNNGNTPIFGIIVN